MATKDDLYDLIQPDVEVALKQTDHSMRMSELRAAAAVGFNVAYDDAGGDPDGYEHAEAEFMNTLNSAATHTFPDGTDEQADRIASIFATAAANAAVVATAQPGTEFEWITMLDDRVREIHRPLHGERRAAGTPFIVGGQPLFYPGQPVGPPDVWINCRCTLHAAVTAAADDTLLAREFDTAKRKAMAKRHTAMPDGSYPIANEEDLRNAIQAIGRAKEPDKVKAHIRRRAKALGLTALIPESWSASAEPVIEVSNDSVTAARGRPSPPGTHDAPGWVTNPRETQRLRTYWTKGEGAAKIRWGQPGDFDRCRKQLRKYVPDPDFLAGTCANLHFVALGFWPNQGPHAGKRGRHADASTCVECENFDPENMSPQGATVTAAFAAIAALDDAAPPREWFSDPGFEGVTALTVTDEGEVLGHIGSWDQCHVGFPEKDCVPPPHSTRDYHHFRTGYVRTADGDVAVGNLTLGTGHAAPGDTATAAIAHYDNTGTAVADVAAGEDQFGIWVHGMLRPGVTPEQVHALRAGTPSGDWRTLGGKYELVAALIVNVPGFPITRPAETLAADGGPISLVAAGIVERDPNAIDVERIAVAVVDRLDERQRRAANVERVAALRAALNTERVRELVAAVGVD